jgi:phosphatidate cytidylyltransferase
MPLNTEVFRTRAISAIVFAAIMLTGLLWNIWSFLALFLVIHAGCWWEYARITEKIEKISIQHYLTLGFIATGMAIMLSFCGNYYAIGNYLLRDNLLLPLSLAGFVLMAMGLLNKGTTITLKGFARLALGLAYISLCWGMMIDLRQKGIGFLFGDLGWILPLILIGSIWINDTMAYIVGSMIGKTPLSAVSPKKTWEGTIGGAILAILVVAIIARFAFNTAWLYAIVIPAIGAIIGTIGDLLESKLKRMAGVKDSGNMMPGHGGFLDRFDSMLLATPAVWVFVQIFG